MADIIHLDRYSEEPDLDSMDQEQLISYLNHIRAQIEALDAQEPEDMDSEEYEAWGDRHEVLEDLADELLDRLEEMGIHV